MNRHRIDKTRLKPVRKVFLIGFISIFFIFTFLIGGTLYLLNLNGVSIEQVRNPEPSVFLICVGCLICSFFAAYHLMMELFDVIEQLSASTKKIAKGDYTVQINYSGKIQEIRNMTEDFNLMAKELNSVETIRNDFIADVSHEFKTPLSALNGYLTLLQDPDLTQEEQEDYIRRSFLSIEKLNHLTENILQLSKLENQNLLPPPQTFRLDEQIREAIVLLEQKWNEKKIYLDIELEKAIYTGQQELLFQVWNNLIANAIKFSNPYGKIFIGMKAFDGDQIIVTIRDEGIGMDEDTQKHIFDKFYQGDTSRQAQGNGLGLALCKEIIYRCGGRIQVQSQLGKGSTFTVYL